MTDGDPDGTTPPPDPRVRRTWLIAAVGAGVAVALSVLTGVLGASGRVGFVVLFLVLALAATLAALYAGATAVVDDLKGRRVARARIVSAVGLFFLAAFLMALVAGAGG